LVPRVPPNPTPRWVISGDPPLSEGNSLWGVPVNHLWLPGVVSRDPPHNAASAFRDFSPTPAAFIFLIIVLLFIFTNLRPPVFSSY